MGVMANAAIFRYRLVVVNERAALLRMALVASLVDAIFLQLLGASGTMRIVAVGAGDLALLDRMARRTVELGALLLVAGEAHFRLGELVAYLIVAGMYLMARSAGSVAVGMGAAGPVDALAALVAGQAGLILARRWRARLLPERDLDLRPLFHVGRLIGVGLALTVATGTGRRAFVGDGAMLGLADGEHRVFLGFVVAACAISVALEHRVLARRLVGGRVRSSQGDAGQQGDAEHQNQALQHDGKRISQVFHRVFAPHNKNEHGDGLPLRSPVTP